MQSGADALAGFGAIIGILALAVGVMMLVLAILIPWNIWKIKEASEQTRNNLRDVNARLEIVVPKLMAWLNRQDAAGHSGS